MSHYMQIMIVVFYNAPQDWSVLHIHAAHPHSSYMQEAAAGSSGGRY